MESYKEKYEQALKIAQETYDKQPMYREWLEKMFPELKEPKDEKIREALIRFHKSTIDIDGIKGADIISWLEKQAEQEPNPCNGCINRKGCINCENGELRETEQKPIETVKWSPQEESCICQLESLVKEQWRQAERVHNSVNIKKMSELMFFLKTLNHNKKPTDEEMKRLLQTEYEKGRADAITEMQKDWSEEDSYYRNYIIQIIEEIKNAPLKRREDWDAYINWLKSLKDKVQPKQKWSEDDIVHLNNCISFMSRLSASEMNWLKSLKERVQPQNRWKPSDEQMVLLSEVQNALLEKDCHNRFTDFMWELKKLKEGKV